MNDESGAPGRLGAPDLLWNNFSINGTSTMNDYSQIPLMPSNAKPLVLEALEKKGPVKKASLDSVVDMLHRNRGGIPGVQSIKLVVKKALQELEKDGEVENVGYGIWKHAGSENIESSQESVITEKSTTLVNIEEKTGITPKKIIGTGAECVYVYYNPNDHELAKVKNLKKWECKIGRCASENPIPRILEQGVKTALSRLPEIGLIIRTDDSSLLEKALHASLDFIEEDYFDSVGNEWFITSPEHIEKWYEAYTISIATLRGVDSENTSEMH